MCGLCGTTMKIYGQTPEIQTWALSLSWAIFMMVIVFKWKQGEGVRSMGFFFLLLLLLFTLAILLTEIPYQILSTVAWSQCLSWICL